jgi:hypothetical protein
VTGVRILAGAFGDINNLSFAYAGMKGKFMKMHFPDYNNSIVNLSNSLIAAHEGKTEYSTLKLLPPEEIKRYDTVLLFVIDGLGYNFLKKQGKSFLWEHTLGKITSTFPAGTGAAYVSIVTGAGPSNHCFTGWHMYFKENKSIYASLPLKIVYGRGRKLKLASLIKSKGFMSKMKSDRTKYNLANKLYAHSEFTEHYSKGSITKSFSDLRDFEKKLKALLVLKRKKFIATYWDGIDHNAHVYGVKSKNTLKHFKVLENLVKRISVVAKKTNTLIIITADHGLIDGERKKTIQIENHPILKSCLKIPKCGEDRASFFYVKRNNKRIFENYVKNELSDACVIYKSSDLIRRGAFGLNPSKALLSRVGDYTLIAKDNYSFFDERVNHKFFIGHHGGTSEDEMYVPLILINPND